MAQKADQLVKAGRATTADAPGLLVAVPAFNEERAIGSIILQARLKGWDVLVVDDGSADQTAVIAEAAGATVKRHKENLGKAQALNTIFRYARDEQVGALLLIDGDGQHLVEEAERVLAPILEDEADIVIGSRFMATSRGDIPQTRWFGLKLITLATKVASGATVSDSQSGYRAFSRRAVELLAFESNGFTAETEMLFSARQHQLRVKEVPITAIYEGAPKRNVFSQGFQVLNGMLRLVSQHRPLLFFGVLGVTSLLIGVTAGLFVVDAYRQTRTLAIGFSLVALLLCIMGLSSLLTGITLYSIRANFVQFEARLRNYLGTQQDRGSLNDW